MTSKLNFKADIMTEKELVFCAGHTENFSKFLKVMKDVTIKIEFLKRDHYFDDKYQRNIYKITISKGQKSISYTFGDSLVNTAEKAPINYDGKEKVNEDIQEFIYSILCCIKSDFYFYCPSNFEEFCDEYGYNNDSIKDKKLFKRCQKMTEDLQFLFTDDEIQYFPD